MSCVVAMSAIVNNHFDFGVLGGHSAKAHAKRRPVYSSAMNMSGNIDIPGMSLFKFGPIA